MCFGDLWKRLLSNCDLLILPLLRFQDFAGNFSWSQQHVRYCCLKSLRVNHCNTDSIGISIAMHVLMWKMLCCVALYKLNTLEISKGRGYWLQTQLYPGIRVFNITEVCPIFHIERSRDGGSASGMTTGPRTAKKLLRTVIALV